jgi:hypothetical protein
VRLHDDTFVGCDNVSFGVSACVSTNVENSRGRVNARHLRIVILVFYSTAHVKWNGNTYLLATRNKSSRW